MLNHPYLGDETHATLQTISPSLSHFLSLLVRRTLVTSLDLHDEIGAKHTSHLGTQNAITPRVLKTIASIVRETFLCLNKSIQTGAFNPSLLVRVCLRSAVLQCLV